MSWIRDPLWPTDAVGNPLGVSGTLLPTPEQMRQWIEQYERLEDRVREQQFQQARLRALVEDVAKLAGVRIKVLEEGEQ